jgi:hypothetical protein
MPILQYETRVSPEGYIALPLMPEYRDRKVVVCVDEEIWQSPVRIESTDKTPEQDFIDFCEELAMPALSDEDVERMKYEHLKKKYQ